MIYKNRGEYERHNKQKRGTASSVFGDDFSFGAFGDDCGKVPIFVNAVALLVRKLLYLVMVGIFLFKF